MSSYRPLTPYSLAPRPENATASSEGRYWRQYHTNSDLRIPHSSKISHIQFDKNSPHHCAVSSSTRVTIYEGSNLEPRRVLSRFTSPVYCPRWRIDGKVLGVGSDDTNCYLMDPDSRMILRTLKGHTSSVKSCEFSSNHVQFVSGADDGVLKLWDIPSERCLRTYEHLHTDAIRCIRESNIHPSIYVTSSYDHHIHFIDFRLPLASHPVLTLNHDAPIESILFLPNSSILISAGSNYMKIFDSVKGEGSPIKSSTSAHEKTITTLCYDDSSSRLLSGGLDHWVKLYDINSFEVTHQWKEKAPILAIDSCKGKIAVGMTDGTLEWRVKGWTGEQPENPGMGLTLLAPPSAAGPTLANPLPSSSRSKSTSRTNSSFPTDDDLTVEHVRKTKLAPFDTALKSFNYHLALDEALKTNKPAVIHCVLDELIERNALILSLRNREEHELESLLRFLLHYLSHPLYSSLLIDVTHNVLDLYSSSLYNGNSILMDELLMKLKDKIEEEIENQRELTNIEGMIEMISRQAGTRVGKRVEGEWKERVKEREKKEKERVDKIKSGWGQRKGNTGEPENSGDNNNRASSQGDNEDRTQKKDDISHHPRPEKKKRKHEREQGAQGTERPLKEDTDHGETTETHVNGLEKQPTNTEPAINRIRHEDDDGENPYHHKKKHNSQKGKEEKEKIERHKEEKKKHRKVK